MGRSLAIAYVLVMLIFSTGIMAQDKICGTWSTTFKVNCSSHDPCNMACQNERFHDGHCDEDYRYTLGRNCYTGIFSSMLVVDPAHRRPVRCGGRWRTVRNNAARACDGVDFHALRSDGGYAVSEWSKTYVTVQPRYWKARTKQGGQAAPGEIKHWPPHFPCQIPFSCVLTSFC
ncbi:hypothetical protein OROGR_010349 [Orobanche gracilis]